MRDASHLAGQDSSSHFLSVLGVNLIAQQLLRVQGDPSIPRDHQTYDPGAPATLVEVPQKMQKIASRHVISCSESENRLPKVGVREEWDYLRVGHLVEREGVINPPLGQERKARTADERIFISIRLEGVHGPYVEPFRGRHMPRSRR